MVHGLLKSYLKSLKQQHNYTFYYFEFLGAVDCALLQLHGYNITLLWLAADRACHFTFILTVAHGSLSACSQC